MAIGFIHPSELLIFKRLPSYQMNSRPTARWWSAPCHLAAECSPALSQSHCVESDCAVTTCWRTPARSDGRLPLRSQQRTKAAARPATVFAMPALGLPSVDRSCAGEGAGTPVP